MFQKMKRVLSLVLALALMVSAGAILTACGDENVDDTTTADETTAESTTGSTLPDFIVELTKQEGAKIRKPSKNAFLHSKRALELFIYHGLYVLIHGCSFLFLTKL